MKNDESIEDMYSRFQTLVSRLQILKKSYVASDHVIRILRSLPARWRPKVTAIEEAKDLNTLSVEDFISSLKCHEIGLNEQESVSYHRKENDRLYNKAPWNIAVDRLSSNEGGLIHMMLKLRSVVNVRHFWSSDNV